MTAIAVATLLRARFDFISFSVLGNGRMALKSHHIIACTLHSRRTGGKSFNSHTANRLSRLGPHDRPRHGLGFIICCFVFQRPCVLLQQCANYRTQPSLSSPSLSVPFMSPFHLTHFRTKNPPHEQPMNERGPTSG